MAIGHLHVGIVSRSAGRSAVDAAAYASRSVMIDQRTGKTYDYSHSGKAADVITSFLWLPQNAPAALRDRATLWNAVEARENRVNSQTARTIELSLPHELTDKQREQLLKDYVRENFTRRGLAADVSIHRAHDRQDADQRNIHAHIVIPTRYVNENGLGAKDRDSNSKETLQQWRDRWEVLVNRQLERHGHEARISMKTLEAQGIDRTPQIHLGAAAAKYERQGIATDRGDQLRAIEGENRQKEQRHLQGWTQGRAFIHRNEDVQEKAATTAIERQKQDDLREAVAEQKAAAREAARYASLPHHLREIATALGRLGRTMGHELAGLVTGATREERREAMMAEWKAMQDKAREAQLRYANLAHDGRKPFDPAKDLSQAKQHPAEPRKFVERDGPANLPEKTAKAPDRSRTWMAQHGGYEALSDELKKTAQANYDKWREGRPGAKFSLPAYVDYVQKREQERDSQPPPPAAPAPRLAPYRAMLQELRGAEIDAQEPVTEIPSPPPTQAPRGSFLEELEAKQKAKGQTLADLLPRDRRKELERDRDDDLSLEL